jgi:hypothetical protein
MSNLIKRAVMKNTIFAIVVFAGIISITSCKKESSSPQQSVDAIITTGSWKVSSFVQPGEDMTINFQGYTFYYWKNGQMSATKDGKSIRGTWAWDSSEQTLHMFIGTDKPLSSINNAWEVNINSINRITLLNDKSSVSNILALARL